MTSSPYNVVLYCQDCAPHAWVVQQGEEILLAYRIPLEIHENDGWSAKRYRIAVAQDARPPTPLEYFQKMGLDVQENPDRSYYNFFQVSLAPLNEASRSTSQDPILTFRKHDWQRYDSGDACSGGSFTYHWWVWMMSPEDLDVLTRYEVPSKSYKGEMKKRVELVTWRNEDVKAPEPYLESGHGDNMHTDVHLMQFLDNRFKMVYRVVGLSLHPTVFKVQVDLQASDKLWEDQGAETAASVDVAS